MSGVVDTYTYKIKELTFNSRPIIDELTRLAKENTDDADAILDVITTRIYKCIPEQKLFNLYLLDSICKTIGIPYNILVGDEVFKIFSHVYLLVNETVRTKLTNLFETWKLTKTKGTTLPLFPKEQLDKIESFLVQAGSKRKSQTKQLTNQSLIKDIDAILPIFENKLINNPDPKLTDRYNALNELKKLLSSQTMKSNELIAVQSQLKAIREQELNNNIAQTSSSTSPITTVPASITQTSSNNNQSGAISSINPTTTPGLSFSQLQQTPSVLNHVDKANELFNVLIISGLVKVDQSLKPGSKPLYQVVLPKNKFIPSATNNERFTPTTNQLEELLLSASNLNKSEYEQLKYNEFLKISKKLSTNGTEGDTTSKSLQSFINSNSLEASNVQLLYECKASKCGTCGKRFTNDFDGSNKKRLHLDWHFRINKKLTNSKSNVQSRNWFLDDYDWVKFRDEDLLEYSTNTKPDSTDNNLVGSNSNYNNNNSNTSNNNNSSGKPSSFIVIPSTETNMNNKCLICRETIKASYNDDLGEWCWFDCVRSPSDKSGRKIVHESCFNEANKKRSADDEHDSNLRVKREKI